MLPNYDDVLLLLEDFGHEKDPAQLQGMLCGMRCVCDTLEKRQWLQVALDNSDSYLEDAQLIVELYTITCNMLANVDFEFQLLLPDDEAALSLRLRALSLWCEGLVAGLGFAEKALQWADGDAKDALADLTAIAEADYDAIYGGEEDEEKAFFEISEYVRMAVLMIYCEATAAQKKAWPNEQDEQTLH